MITCFAVFLTELVIKSWTKTSFNFKSVMFNGKNISSVQWEGYLFSYMWLLDIIVILSLSPYIPGVFSGMQSKPLNYILISFIRLLKLIQTLQTYCFTLRRPDLRQLKLEIMRKCMNDSNINLIEELRKLENSGQPSKLGELLRDTTTTKVVFVIVTLLIIISLLNYRPSTEVFSYSTALLQNINENKSLPDFIKDACILSLITILSEQYIPIIYLEMSSFKNESTINIVQESSNLRDFEIVTQLASLLYNKSTINNYYTAVEYSNSCFYQTVSKQILSVCFFVGVVIIVATIVINRDTAYWVLKPISVCNLYFHNYNIISIYTVLI